jgi:hypothetical protein
MIIGQMHDKIGNIRHMSVFWSNSFIHVQLHSLYCLPKLLQEVRKMRKTHRYLESDRAKDLEESANEKDVWVYKNLTQEKLKSSGVLE